MIRCVWVRAQDDLMVLLTFVCLVGGLGGGGVVFHVLPIQLH